MGTGRRPDAPAARRATTRFWRSWRTAPEIPSALARAERNRYLVGCFLQFPDQSEAGWHSLCRPVSHRSPHLRPDLGGRQGFLARADRAHRYESLLAVLDGLELALANDFVDS